jgi:hypothetical protein
VKADLAAARAAWINEAKDDSAEMKRREQSQFLVHVNAKGQYGDMHAWRHSFVSTLVASGVNYKMAVELARHSDARIALERYAHVEQEAAVEAVNRMPQFLAATGTDGPQANSRLDRAFTKPVTKPAVSATTHEGAGSDFQQASITPNSLHLKVFAETSGDIRKDEEEYARRDSNPQPMVPKPTGRDRTICLKTQSGKELGTKTSALEGCRNCLYLTMIVYRFQWILYHSVPRILGFF